MLSLNKVNVYINENILLKDINLSIEQGDIIAILAPNGTGKSTLLKAIMGFNSYKIDGSIKYNEEEISKLNIHDRAKLGIFLSSQNPIEINGITELDFLKTIYQEKYGKINLIDLYKKINQILKSVNLNDEILSRFVNEGFSGGEKKKNEIAQMLLLNPDIILLDEIDSGLDVDAQKTIFTILKNEINLKKTIVFVSHQLETLNILKPNKVVLIANNTIVKIGDFDFGVEILKNGYKKILSKLGIKEKQKELLDVCIGSHFEK